MIPILTPYPFWFQPTSASEVVPHDGKHHTLTGNFRRHSGFHSNFLADDRDVLVYLPPEYETSGDRHYPVLYLHDGQNLFDGATSFIPGQEWHVDETAESLIEREIIEPVIIVGIYNSRRRMEEYTPTSDGKGHGGQADLYGRMLVEELKPMIDKTYRTQKGAEHTALGGSSLGGLVTLHIGLKYPGTFGKLAVMSPSVWWDKREIVHEIRHLRTKPQTRVWLDIGTAEGQFPKRTVADTRKLRDAMIRKGWTLDRDLAYMEADGAGHNEGAWASRVGSMLHFLFPARR